MHTQRLPLQAIIHQKQKKTSNPVKTVKNVNTDQQLPKALTAHDNSHGSWQKRSSFNLSMVLHLKVA